jgi:hypothetical protein
MNIHPVNNTHTSDDLKYGYIAALKDGFGFIETIALDSEVFFRYAYVETVIFILYCSLIIIYNLEI